MYYLIDNDEDLRYDDVEDVLEYCISLDYYVDDTDGFDEYVNSQGDIDIEGYSYAPSDILRDRGDYDDAIRHWAENQMDNCWSDYRWEVEGLRDGQSCWVCNYEVYAYDDDEEETEENEEISEHVVETIEARVEITVKEEQAVHEENKRLEDEFMSVFQTLS